MRASGVVSSPAVGPDGDVYVGSENHEFHRLDGRTGVPKWLFEAEYWIKSSPAIGDDDTVYFGSQDHKIYAVDLRTGARRWEFETMGGVGSSPVIGSDGILYLGSYDDQVYAIATSSSGLAKSSWPMFGQNPQRTQRAVEN